MCLRPWCTSSKRFMLRHHLPSLDWRAFASDVPLAHGIGVPAGVRIKPALRVFDPPTPLLGLEIGAAIEHRRRPARLRKLPAWLRRLGRIGLPLAADLEEHDAIFVPRAVGRDE